MHGSIMFDACREYQALPNKIMQKNSPWPSQLLKFNHTFNAGIWRWTLLSFVIIGGLFMVGCSSPISDPSRIMVVTSAPQH